MHPSCSPLLFVMEMDICLSWKSMECLFFWVQCTYYGCLIHFQVKVFQQPNYLHNFVQSTFDALTTEKVRGKSHECVIYAVVLMEL